ncbi:MAG: RlmI/RlmK family 23S rRNA methyltransferase, partial [Halomonas sp.]
MTQRLRLNKNAERRLKAGHLWIYSNEVDVKETPLKNFTGGESAIVEESNGRALGVAYVNPHSLICARIMSRDPSMRLDRSLFIHRFNQALALRERLFNKPFYRLVHGEGDLLPGLVVDRFGDILVVQLNTAGMQGMSEEIVDALDKVLKPSAIVFRNDTGGRRQEGLEAQVEVVKGELPDEVLIEENGVHFVVPVLNGQRLKRAVLSVGMVLKARITGIYS